MVDREKKKDAPCEDIRLFPHSTRQFERRAPDIPDLQEAGF